MSKLTFISGATGGLGKAFAVECASRGWDVFLTDISNQRLDTLSASLQRTYDVHVHRYACDMTDADARAGLFTYIREQQLSFRMLINVAGVDHEGTFIERRRDEIITIVRLNVEATLDVTHALLDCATPNEPLRIINVSSLAAFYPMPVKATYAASKRFLLDFSLALRDEIRHRGATVTVLCPAGLPTTPESIQAIQSQGIMGQLTTMDIGAVAANTIDHALRGHAVYIPGLLNRFIQVISTPLPKASLASLIGDRWRAAHRRRLASQQDF